METSESREKVLEILVREFGDDSINFAKTDSIRLYGADDGVLRVFRDKLLSYLKEKGKETEVEFGQNGTYNIDVGFFLRLGYFNGFREKENLWKI